MRDGANGVELERNWSAFGTEMAREMSAKCALVAVFGCGFWIFDLDCGGLERRHRGKRVRGSGGGGWRRQGLPVIDGSENKGRVGSRAEVDRGSGPQEPGGEAGAGRGGPSRAAIAGPGCSGRTHWPLPQVIERQDINERQDSTALGACRARSPMLTSTCPTVHLRA